MRAAGMLRVHLSNYASPAARSKLGIFPWSRIATRADRIDRELRLDEDHRTRERPLPKRRKVRLPFGIWTTRQPVMMKLLRRRRMRIEALG
jgi:hypothetical protein